MQDTALNQANVEIPKINCNRVVQERTGAETVESVTFTFCSKDAKLIRAKNGEFIIRPKT